MCVTVASVVVRVKGVISQNNIYYRLCMHSFHLHLGQFDMEGGGVACQIDKVKSKNYTKQHGIVTARH